MNALETNFSFSPYLSGEPVKEMDRKILNEQFLEINMLAVPMRLAGAGIDNACHSSQIMEKVCQVYADALITIYETIPESIRSSVETQKHLIEEQIALHNYEERGIPPEETRYALESLLMTAPGSGAVVGAAVKLPGRLANRMVQAVKQQRVIDPMRRVEKAFQKGWKAFEGEISQDLCLVQYRGEGNSLRWWTTVNEANNFFTVKDASRRLALLSSFGERTHVSFAVVPKGAKTQFLSGKARFQVDISKLEFLKGGGKQFYFPDFNPAWVRETRLLPRQVRTVRKVNNLGDKFTKLRKLLGSLPLPAVPGREGKTPSADVQERRQSDPFVGKIDNVFFRKRSESSSEETADEHSVTDRPFDMHSNADTDGKEVFDQVSVDAQVVLLSPKSSSLSISSKISEDIAVGIHFSPFKPRQVQLSLNTDQCGVFVPLANPKHTSISIPLKCNESTSASISLCPGDPLQSGISGKVTVPIEGIPVTFSGSLTLKHPENLKLGVSVPTCGLDKIIPGLPKEVQLLSTDLKKLRHQVQSIAHKIGIGSKRRKKRRRAKAMNKAFASAAAKNERREKDMAMQFDHWLRETSKNAASAVEEEYTPLLIKELSTLSQELINFRDKLADVEMLEFSLQAREALQLDRLGSILDEVNSFGFVETVREVFFELQRLSEVMDEILPAMVKLTSTLEASVIQADRMTKEYEALQTSFHKTEQISDELLNSKEAVVSFLCKSTSKDLLRCALEQLCGDKINNLNVK